MRRLWNTRSRTVRLKPARWWNKTHCVIEQLYGALCNYLHDIIIAYDIRSETRARLRIAFCNASETQGPLYSQCSCQLMHIARSVRTKLCAQRVAHGRAPAVRELYVKFKRSRFIWVTGHCMSNAFDLTMRQVERAWNCEMNTKRACSIPLINFSCF